MTKPRQEPAASPKDDDLNRASRQISARLGSLGIRLDGSESAEDLADIAEAIERFEEAVQGRGGDLMVDEGPHGVTQPDDPDFALPMRAHDETVRAYLQRLARATDVVLEHRPES